MTEPLNLPETCTRALEAILADPLDPGVATEAHLKGCAACSESRVVFLAQEEVPQALAPADYFERLPLRVLGKLPVPSQASHTRRFYWGTAAALLLAVGTTAFWAGRANRAPLVEASLPKATSETMEFLPDTPFQDNEDAVSQLTDLTPEEADAVFRALDGRQAHPPAKP
jgi:hypothetical protein